VTITGSYIFAIFSILAAIVSITEVASMIVFVQSALLLIQITLQGNRLTENIEMILKEKATYRLHIKSLKEFFKNHVGKQMSSPCFWHSSDRVTGTVFVAFPSSSWFKDETYRKKTSKKDIRFHILYPISR
jgi:hypothetical protein